MIIYALTVYCICVCFPDVPSIKNKRVLFVLTTLFVSESSKSFQILLLNAIDIFIVSVSGVQFSPLDKLCIEPDGDL